MMSERKLHEQFTYLSRLMYEHKEHMNPKVCSQKKTAKTVQECTYESNYLVQSMPVSSKHVKMDNKPCQVDWKMDTSGGHSVPSHMTTDSNLKTNYVMDKYFYGSVHGDTRADSTKWKLGSSEPIPLVQKFVTKIHINPHYFNSKNKDSIPNVTCKSVHINPRVLAIRNKVFDFEDSRSDKEPVSSSLLAKDTDYSVIKDVHKNELPTKEVGKKYLYRSRRKLVKVPVNNQNSETRHTLNSETMLPAKSKLPAHSFIGSKCVKTPNGGTLMALSRTKLVRMPAKLRRQSLEKIHDSPVDTSTPFSSPSKLNTKFRKPLFPSTTSHSIKVAKKVCSKYKSCNKATLPCSVSSKYRIDRRTSKTSKRSGNVKTAYKVDRRMQHSSKTFTRRKYNTDTRVLQSNKCESNLSRRPVHRLSFRNRVWAKPGLQSQKITISQKRLSRIGRHTRTQNKQDSALIRIGGVLYKTSRTKLIVSKGCKTDARTALPKPRTVVKRRKLNSGNTLYVCGNKFIMDSTGKTLRRVMDSPSNIKSTLNIIRSKRSRLSRVDIGGVTYVQKSPNVLIRTNTHTARNVVSNAKHKSIAVLTRKMRKNNEHCLFYRRFGKCPRLERGRCELVHDSKYIDICKKFLQGKCDKKDCLLSHDLIPEKMPTCRFFLEGCCVRDNCPYLHVKVNDKAPICRNFLLGFCAAGELCSGRHMLLCPDFDKKGVCRKGKFCRFPHPLCPKIHKTPIDIVKEPEEPKQPEQTTEPSKRKRYYESESFLEELKTTPTEVNCKELDLKSECHSDHETSPKRSKIGDLPSFISLEYPELNG